MRPPSAPGRFPAGSTIGTFRTGLEGRMPGGMPYSFEKGPYFSVVESFANSSSANMLKALRHLRAGKPISDLPALDSVTLDAGPYDKAQLAAHLDRDWFGFHQDPTTGKWSKQPDFNPA